MNPQIRTDSKLFMKGILNSYSQVFFSEHRLFAFLLILITFIDLFAGFCGLLSVLVTISVGYIIGLDKQKISRGIYGFNSLLVGLGLGIYYDISIP
ncbi:MAG: urea transporter, partial [Bacteroidales bacterium]